MITKELTEKRKQFIINFMYWGIVVVGGLLLAKYILPTLFPFIIAFIVACMLNKPIQYITKKINGHRKIASVVMLLLFLAFSSVGISYICYSIFRALEGIFTLLPTLFRDIIIPFIEQTFEQMNHIFYNMDLSLLEILEQNTSLVLDSINQAVTHFSNGILTSLANIISAIPTLFMKTIITIIAMFFITFDYEKIVSYLKYLIPDNKKRVCSDARNFFICTLPKFILFYGIIMCLTFVELLIGFSILKIPHAAFFAVIIAVLDILPVLGTGTILIPWAIFNLLNANYSLALGIFLLYLVITIIRNIVEPKLIGKHMGLHPVVTLASMLVGMKLFGVWGLFGLPIGISFINILNKKETKDKFY